MRKPVKCIVMGCLNYSDGGQMIGELCSPCHEMLTTGKVHPNNPTFIGHMYRDLIAADLVIQGVASFFQIQSEKRKKRALENAATD